MSRTLRSRIFGRFQDVIGSLNFSSHFGFKVFHFTFVAKCFSPRVPLTKGSEYPAQYTVNVQYIHCIDQNDFSNSIEKAILNLD